MPDIILIGSPRAIEELDVEENPVDVFPCMNAGSIHTEARALLYCAVTGSFLDDALDLECLVRHLGDEGPVIYGLEESAVHALAALDEDDIEEVVLSWQTSEPLEALAIDSSDLTDFVFQFVHFCQTALQGDDLGIYFYMDG